MVTQSTSVAPARRNARLSLRVSFVVALITILGTAWLWFDGRTSVAVYELKSDLPAFQILKASDVVVTTAVPDKDGKKFADSVIGKYTITEIKSGEPIFAGDLGPSIDVLGVNDETVVVGVPASSAQAIGGRLNAGDRVQIASLDNPDKFQEIVLLSVEKASESSETPFVLVMAVPASATTLLRVLGSGDFILTLPLSASN